MEVSLSKGHGRRDATRLAQVPAKLSCVNSFVDSKYLKFVEAFVASLEML